jgi:hypothetical protein
VDYIRTPGSTTTEPAKNPVMIVEGPNEIVLTGPGRVAVYAFSRESFKDVSVNRGTVVLKMRPVGTNLSVIAETDVQRARKSNGEVGWIRAK